MRSTFKVLFYLKKNKQKPQNPAPVMGRITVNGTIAQFSAKISVVPNLWEVNGGRAKGKSLEADRINSHLDNIRSQIAKHYQSIVNRDGYVSADKVKNAYLGFGERYKLLLELCDGFCREYGNRVGVDRSEDSLIRYRQLRKDLSRFLNVEYNIRDIPLAELDQSFAQRFASYLKHDRQLADTTVGLFIKLLKHVIKRAFNDGLLSRNPFAYYHYIAGQPKREFLTEEEIARLINGTLQMPQQERTRDMYLFCCFTGLSYADLAKLTYEELTKGADGSWWISSTRQKTKVPFTVKLLPVAVAILEKYRRAESCGRVFPVASLDSSNASMKHIARQCGIGKHLTFHTARHTFATTIALMNGVPLETLSKMLGHRFTTTTQIYARITQPMVDREIDSLAEKIEGRYIILARL